MITKNTLVGLAAKYDIPADKYQELPEFLEFQKSPDLVERIEKYHLPEITKLICDSL